MATFFVLFNVGIPVVVAACPMMPKSGTMACDACATPGGNGGDSVRSMVDRSCCTTVFAALPSGATFLKAPAAAVADDVIVIALLPHAGMNGPAVSDLVRTIRHEQGARAPSDLPILFSSLLI